MALGPKAIIINNLTPYSSILSYNCADGNALSKGTLVELWGAYTASKANAYTLGSSTTSGAFLGIVVRDKESGDGAPQVAVLKEGRADIRASGAITKGNAVYCAGNDEVRALSVATTSEAISANLANAMMVGIAEETASDGEVIVVRFIK